MSTSPNRGDLVIVDFRHSNPAAGVRPALVVQNDRDNARLSNTIVVQISTNLRRAHEDTQLQMDPQHADWAASGLLHASTIICSNIYTINCNDVARTIGYLSAETMQNISEKLKLALALT